MPPRDNRQRRQQLRGGGGGETRITTQRRSFTDLEALFVHSVPPALSKILSTVVLGFFSSLNIGFPIIYIYIYLIEKDFRYI